MTVGIPEDPRRQQHGKHERPPDAVEMSASRQVIVVHGFNAKTDADYAPQKRKGPEGERGRWPVRTTTGDQNWRPCNLGPRSGHVLCQSERHVVWGWIAVRTPRLAASLIYY